MLVGEKPDFVGENQDRTGTGMGQQHNRTEAMERMITDQQLHELDADEKSAILFYLAGFLAESDEFQDAMTRAYAAQMRSRERGAAKATK